MVGETREGPFPVPESSDEEMPIGRRLTTSHEFPIVAADSYANRTESVNVSLMSWWLGQITVSHKRNVRWF